MYINKLFLNISKGSSSDFDVKSIVKNIIRNRKKCLKIGDSIKVFCKLQFKVFPKKFALIAINKRNTALISVEYEISTIYYSK